jgi:flagellar biosynthesis protein FlhF
MSTLSFQDYVRERMLKRRQADCAAAAPPAPARRRRSRRGERRPRRDIARRGPGAHRAACRRCCARIRYEPRAAAGAAAPRDTTRPRQDHADSARRDSSMLNELRQVKGLIEERFGALAFMEKLQRSRAARA